MRILVSGAAGFLGSHFCERLIAEGHEVFGLDNGITGCEQNVAHLLKHPRFDFEQQDVTKGFRIPGRFQAVCHFASIASPKHYLAYPVQTLESGSIGTQNMLEVARQSNAAFLLTSTSECYGDPTVHPQTEDYWGNVNPIGLRSCYDESKRYAEALTMAYHREYGISTHIARIFNTYGPRMSLRDGRVLPNFIDQALRGENLSIYGDGNQTRSFCYVSDLIEGLYRLMRSKEALPVNLGNPHEVTINCFAELIREFFNKTVELSYHDLPADDPKQRKPDIEKAKRVLGWEPVVDLKEGLKTTVDYFRLGQVEGTRKTCSEDVLQSYDIAALGRGLDGTIAVWNDAAKRSYGYEADDAVGQVSHTLLRTVFPEPLDSINRQLLRDGYWEGPLLHHRRDDTAVQVTSRWKLKPLHDGDGLAVVESNELN